MQQTICFFIGYLFGCFLTAALTVKLATGRSVFEIGSRNPGMANVMANVGRKEGALVLAGDSCKTMLAMGISYVLFKGSLGRDAMLWAGLGAVVGHDYPFWHRFRGGRGVAVTVTSLILLFPLWGIPAAVVGGLITVISGDLWLGAILIPLLALPFTFIYSSMESGVVVLIMLLMMIQKNFSGVIKILKGEEHRRFRKNRKNSEKRMQK